MTRQWIKPLVTGAAVAAVATGTLLASAWEIKAPLNITVNGHEFYEFRMRNEGCALKVKFRFKAPDNAYKSGLPNYDWYRFKARLELSNGVAVDSPVFYNRRTGRRFYSFTHDTTAKGCWAKTRANVYEADVVGCRGRHCRVRPFKAAE